MLSMVQFCATALSEIAGVAWHMNDTVKYLKIGSGHEITVCAILGSIGISEHFSFNNKRRIYRSEDLFILYNLEE